MIKAITTKSRWELLLIATMAAWGMHYPLLKVISEDVDPVLLTLIRFTIAVIILTPIIRAFHTTHKPERQDLKSIIAIGILLAASSTLIFIGIKYSSEINGAVLVNSNPLLVTLLAPIILHKHISFKKVLAINIGVIAMGITIMNGRSIEELFQSKFLTGSILLMASAIILSIVTIWERKYIEKYGGLYFTYLTMLAGVGVFLLLTLIQGSLFDISNFNSTTIATLLFIGVFTTALPYALWNASLSHIDVRVAASFKFLTPAFTALYAVLFFDQSVTIWIASGIILTSGAIYAMQKN